jgi:hypothetical protein
MSKYFSSITTEYRVDFPIDTCPLNPEEELGREYTSEEEMDCWRNGEVYGFRLFARPIDSDDETEWKEIDSCWGFYTWNPEKDIMESGYIDIMAIQLADEKAQAETFALALENV